MHSNQKKEADAMLAPTKVYLCTDTYTIGYQYYIVAPNEREARRAASGLLFPPYPKREQERVYEETTVDEEAETLSLSRISSTTSTTDPETVRLIPTKRDDPHAYHGYPVEESIVVMEDRAYPRDEWREVDSAKHV